MRGSLFPLASTLRLLLHSSGSRQVSIVSVETPFGRLSEIQAHYGVAAFRKWKFPPALATDLRKLLLWLTLACVSRREDSRCQKQIDWAGSFAWKRSKWAGFTQKWAWLPNFCERCARNNITETLFKKSWIRHCCIQLLATDLANWRYT